MSIAPNMAGCSSHLFLVSVEVSFMMGDDGRYVNEWRYRCRVQFQVYEKRRNNVLALVSGMGHAPKKTLTLIEHSTRIATCLWVLNQVGES